MFLEQYFPLNFMAWGDHRPIPNSVHGLGVYFRLWKLISNL